MSGYQRINFKDQNVERPKTYDVTNNPDGSITLIESFGNVEELGTPINQENMNHIEDGLSAVSFSKYNIDTVFQKDEFATDIQDGKLIIIKSLKDNNYGHLPSEKDWWEIIELGGSGGLEVGDIGFTQGYIDETKNQRRYLDKANNYIIQDQFKAFTTWLKASAELNPDMVCTNEEYETELALSPNNACEKYVINDEAGTIRLPKYPEYKEINKINSTKAIYVVESVTSGTSGYTVWSNGLCEQWGYAAKGTNTTIELFKTYNSTNYNVVVTYRNASEDASAYTPIVRGITASKFVVHSNGAGAQSCAKFWRTRGFLSGYAETDYAVSSQEKIKGKYFIQVATGAEESIDTTRATEINNPFFFGQSEYFEVQPNNPSWVKSTGSYLSKAVYPDYYDWLLRIYNGTETQEGVSVKEVGASDITDYDFVINQTDETFRLPLKTYKSDDSINELDLYYYIGEGIVNPQLVNVARIEEIKANKSDVDGQWILTPNTTVVENVTLGVNADRIVDLSSYLPNDGHFYQIGASISHVSAAQGVASVIYQDSNGNILEMLSSRNQVASQRASTSGFIIVGADRKIHCKSGGASVAQFYLILRGYRRLGTNQ